MTDADPFLKAILAQPDDDAPRLIFADWLEEHGQGAHAEFVRVQCGLAPHPTEDETWLAMKLHEEELWGVLRQAWDAILRDLWPEELRYLGRRPLALDDFRRGFFHHFAMNASPQAFAQQAGRWTFVLSIEELGLVGPATPEFFAAPGMWRVEAIDGERAGVTDEALQPFATSPHYGRLRTLNFYCNVIGPDGSAALARCPSLTGLTALILDENRVGDAGAQALAASPVCRTLERLDLSGNDIGDSGAIALAHSPHLASLRRLRLANNRFGTAAVEALAASPHLARLQELQVMSAVKYDYGSPVFRELTQRLGGGFDCQDYGEEE
jgi:uncharacterized protein (TIGR02996 family)